MPMLSHAVVSTALWNMHYYPNPITDKEEELTFMEQKVALMKERDLSTVLRNN